MTTRSAPGGPTSKAGGGSLDPPPAASRLATARAIAVILALAAMTVGCGRGDGSGSGRDGADSPIAEPTDLAAASERAVRLEVGGCGHADASRGSGLALADDLVLTAAHVVASGGPIDIVVDGHSHQGDLVAYDPSRDLALVRPAPRLAAVPPAPTSGTLAEGEPGQIVGAATTGDVAATVTEVLIVEMDDVREPTRSTRRAYLTEAETAPGDSGAGFYDPDGRLIGLLFAVSTTDEARSWVTAASEIDAFLIDEESTGSFACDPDRSKVTRTG